MVQQGTLFTRTGSFTDPSGDGPWTATVNYGDGTGTQPAGAEWPINFTLSHTFANAGTFLTTVTVTNSAGPQRRGQLQRDRQRLHRQRRQPAASRWSKA